MIVRPAHTSLCHYCGGVGMVCATHPERPYWSTRLREACPCDDEGMPCLLGRHGAAWFGQVDALLRVCERLGDNMRRRENRAAVRTA